MMMASDFEWNSERKRVRNKRMDTFFKLVPYMTAVFCSSVSVNREDVTVNQHAQTQDPETEAAKQDSAIFTFTTCTFPGETCLKVGDVLVKTVDEWMYEDFT